MKNRDQKLIDFLKEWSEEAGFSFYVEGAEREALKGVWILMSEQYASISCQDEQWYGRDKGIIKEGDEVALSSWAPWDNEVSIAINGRIEMFEGMLWFRGVKTNHEDDVMTQELANRLTKKK